MSGLEVEKKFTMQVMLTDTHLEIPKSLIDTD